MHMVRLLEQNVQLTLAKKYQCSSNRHYVPFERSSTHSACFDLTPLISQVIVAMLCKQSGIVEVYIDYGPDVI